MDKKIDKARKLTPEEIKAIKQKAIEKSTDKSVIKK